MKHASDLRLTAQPRYRSAQPRSLVATADAAGRQARLAFAMLCVSVIWGYLFFMALQAAGVTNG